jgi:hypothetical protein
LVRERLEEQTHRVRRIEVRGGVECEGVVEDFYLWGFGGSFGGCVRVWCGVWGV